MTRPNLQFREALNGTNGHAQQEHSQSAPPEVAKAATVEGSKKRRAEESEASLATGASNSRRDAHINKRTKGESPAETGQSERQTADNENMAVDEAARPSRKRPLRSEAGASEAREISRARKVQRVQKSESNDREAIPGKKLPSDDDIDIDEDAADRKKTVESDVQEEDERVQLARQRLRSRGKLKGAQERQVSGSQSAARSTNLEVKDEDREAGDQWENSAGDLYRKDKDGQIRQLVELFQPTKQHKMVSAAN